MSNFLRYRFRSSEYGREWIADTLEDLLRQTLFKSEDEIGAETLALHFIATEIGHKNVHILLQIAETLA